MANHETDEIAELRQRVEALEDVVRLLQGRIIALETPQTVRSGAVADFDLVDREPTV